MRLIETGKVSIPTVFAATAFIDLHRCLGHEEDLDQAYTDIVVGIKNIASSLSSLPLDECPEEWVAKLKEIVCFFITA